jgi:hypothetical protein
MNYEFSRVKELRTLNSLKKTYLAEPALYELNVKAHFLKEKYLFSSDRM